MYKFLKIFFVLISIVALFSNISFAETTNLYDEIENTDDSETLIEEDIDSEDEEEDSESQKNESMGESGSMRASTPTGLASTRKFC